MYSQVQDSYLGDMWVLRDLVSKKLRYVFKLLLLCALYW